jgi:hypothetical protein
MKIYHYHPDYKTYLGFSYADESPLEPGVFLIPAHATDTEPPDHQEGKIHIFNGTSWDIIDDYRGIYYNIPAGQEIQHQDPLVPPENATKEVPPEVPEGYVLEWNDGWELIQLPPAPELTPEQKLAQSGLTVEELKELLGL